MTFLVPANQPLLPEEQERMDRWLRLFQEGKKKEPGYTDYHPPKYVPGVGWIFYPEDGSRDS
jgi:hypothetical protein